MPPGTILQLLYWKERLARLEPGRFIEVGVGGGHISRCLLELGWTGVGVELDPQTAAQARADQRAAIDQGKYQVVSGDWLEQPAGPKADLIVSSMVLEHLSEVDERRYFVRCRENLADGGRAILFVPGSPGHWGIEDEIAGHLRRYSPASLRTLLGDVGWKAGHIAGLTCPLSNVLLPLSNYLVRRSEAHKLELKIRDRTLVSGRREIPGKTIFPAVFSLLLNEWTMLPLHLLQKLFRRSERAMVLYVECTPA